MKVKELKKYLNNFNDDDEVAFQPDLNGWGEYECEDISIIVANKTKSVWHDDWTIKSKRKS